MPCDQIQYIEDISPLVEKILSRSPAQTQEEQRLDVKLCLFELLSNAIRHRANHAHPPQISITWVVDGEGLAFEIHSPGEPATAHVCSRPILNEACLLDESGRGLFLVDSLADSFTYSEDFRDIRVELSW